MTNNPQAKLDVGLHAFLGVMLAIAAVAAFVFCTNGMRIVLAAALGICSLLSFVLLFRVRQIENGIALIDENMKRLTSDEALNKLTVPDALKGLDASLWSMKAQFNELSRKEQSAIEQSLDMICTIGPDQIIQSVNPASRRILGYDPGEMVGHKFTEFICEQERDNAFHLSIGSTRSVDLFSFENRMLHKDGSIRHMLWSAHWSVAEQALFCVIHDHTERKIAERQIADSEAKIRQIIEVLPVGLLIANKLGIVESANETFIALSAFTKEQSLTKHLQIFLPELFVTAKAPDFAPLIGTLTDTRLKLSSGEYASVQVTASELSLQSNQLFLVAVVDTSEKEKLEQVKREFFSMINHDLRAPLTSLLSVFDLLDEGALGQLTDRGAEVIRRNSCEVNRLVKLVDELLDIEKMEYGKFEIDAESCDVDSLIEVAINSIQLLAQRQKINIRYARHSLHVFADRSLLIRTLINLLSNAIKFSPADSDVNIHVEDVPEGIMFAVSDNGIGISEDQQDEIFKHYQQGKDASKQKGTGLGLAICKMIVEQHGGKIWVESKPGHGSVFKFTIPAA